MSNNFKEELFTFVHKVIPNINTSMFQKVKSYYNGYLYNLILMPKSSCYFPYMGNKGFNAFDDYYERHFYTIKLENDGFYKIINIVQVQYLNGSINNVISEVTCKEFYDNFYLIKQDLKLLLKDDLQIEYPIKSSAKKYRDLVTSLMTKT